MNERDITGTEAQKRAGYIKGLRALADDLEQHEEVPLPSTGTNIPVLFSFLSGTDPREAMAAVARTLPCKWTKNVWESGERAYFDMNGELYGLWVQLGAFRDAVCERVVTGTEDREVEEVVEPAKTRTVVKPVETVEWRCHPVLAPAAQPESPVPA